MTRNIVLTYLFSVLLSQLNAQFDPNARYKLTNLSQPAKSLDVINDNNNFDQVWLAATKDVTGQAWTIIPVPGEPGYYKLSPQYQPQKSLSSSLRDFVNTNEVWLEKTQSKIGQMWSLRPVEGMKDCYKVAAGSSGKWLNIKNDGNNNRLQMATADYKGGQIWKITKISTAASQTVVKDKKENVQFAAGQSDVTLTRTIEAEGSIEFKVNARQGQSMDFTVGYDFNDSDVEAYLQEPGLQNEIALSTGPKSHNEFMVTRAGVHGLFVSNTTKKRITITLYLTLANPVSAAPPPPKPAPAPEKDKKENVQFSNGQSDVTLTRTIEAEGSIEFKVNARQGQSMDFTVGYDFNDSDVEAYLQEPGLQNEIALSTGPKSPNEFKVTRAGVHSLFVTNTTKKRITITLYLILSDDRMDCQALNGYYVPKAWQNWTDADRNTAISLLVNYSKAHTLQQLQGFNNERLKGLINNLCK